MQIANIPIEFGGGHQKPNRIIIHAMGEFIDDGTGRVYSAVDWLKNLKLSVHSLVTPSGVDIRCRDDDQIAWHAKGYNANSLGMEFLVPGVHNYESFLTAIKTEYLTAEQYQAGVDQVREWMDQLSIGRIDRHSDVSPGRKQDPGEGFPWQQFLHDTGAR